MMKETILTCPGKCKSDKTPCEAWLMPDVLHHLPFRKAVKQKKIILIGVNRKFIPCDRCGHDLFCHPSVFQIWRAHGINPETGFPFSKKRRNQKHFRFVIGKGWVVE